MRLVKSYTIVSDFETRVQPVRTLYRGFRCAIKKNKGKDVRQQRLLALSRNSGFAVRFRIMNPSSSFRLYRVANDATAVRKTLQYGIYIRKYTPYGIAYRSRRNPCKDYYKYTAKEPESQA